MSEHFVNALENLHNSGVISGFVCSIIPHSELRSGWIEQSIIYKMIPPELSEKDYYLYYLITGDRVVRLAHDLDAIGEDTSLLFILGEPGLTSSKLVVVVCTIESKPLLIIWRTQHQNINNIITFFLTKILRNRIEFGNLDVDYIDYIESMRVDAADGRLKSAFSARIPKDITTIDSIIRQASRVSESDEIPLLRGNVDTLQQMVKIFPRWLKGLKVFQPMKNGIISCIVLGPFFAKIALWDTPRSIASFAFQEPVQLTDIFARYVLPFWITVGDVTQSTSSIPSTTRPQSISADKSRVVELVDLLETKLGRFRDLPIQFSTMQERIDRIEQTIKIQKQTSGDTGFFDKEVGKAFYRLVTRLEQVTERLEKLESELNLIIKNL